MYVCLDLGGTAIKAAVADEQANLISKKSLPVAEDLNELLDIIVSYINEVKSRYSIKGVAISAPGAVDSKTGIIHGTSALLCIHGPSITELIKKRVGLKVSIENDANCAALAEVFNGRAKGMNDVLLLVCGTGIGGSIVKDGKIHSGNNLHGGEFGFMIMEEEDGKFTNFSRYASTMSFVRKIRAYYKDDSWDGKKVFKAAEEGNEICKSAIDRFYLNLAKGIYNLQYIYDPEVILIGGGISSRKDFIDNINKKLDYLMLSIEDSTIRPTISVCQHKNDANLIGALVHYMNINF